MTPQARDLSLPVVLITRDFTFLSNENTLNGAFNCSVMDRVAYNVILSAEATTRELFKKYPD